MKIIKNRCKVIDTKTGGVKMIKYDNTNWYALRKRYKVLICIYNQTLYTEEITKKNLLFKPLKKWIMQQ